MQCKFIFASIVLLVGHVHSFPWDIVVGSGQQLEFYFNGTLTHTEIIPSAQHIHSVTYDPVQYRVLFVNRNTDNLIYSFDISTKKTQHLITRTWDGHYLRVVYDPVTQALYWRAGRGIYTYSLNPAASNKEVDGKLLIPLDHIAMDLAVDSCGRYIYWITDKEIERARLDGSEREVLIDYTVYLRRSLAIDQKTQKIYWIERNSTNDKQAYIESASFNGKNRTTLYIVRDDTLANSLAVTKDAIYWHNYYQGGIWQLSKNQKPLQATKLYSMSQTVCGACQQIAANYTLKEQTEGIKSCDALRGLIPNDSKSTSTVSICQYYCFQGECSVSAEGRPTCSCKAGYSGERCEVNCHDYCLHGAVCSLNEENKRVCQCTSGYEGDRCDVSICKDYCFQGNCSVAAEGQPKCSCEPGYSGKRCEVSACKNHCLNNGVCSLNEDGEPVCECTSGYEGERCDVSICKDYCLQGNCSLDAVGLPKCSCLIGYSGVRCEVNACHEYCLNGGVCSLNEEDEPSCQCTADYDGVRCELSAYKNNSCDTGSTGEGKVSACHQFCLNDGVCSLNEASEPVCQCTADYAGDRCDIPAFMAKWVLHAYKDVAPVTRSDAVKSTCASTVV